MAPHPPRRRCLVADVGGTNTRLAFAAGGRVIADTVRNYSNHESSSAEQILRRFLRAHDFPRCDGCCVAAAGPRFGGRVSMTNLDWVIEPAGVRRAVKTERVALLNDLEAVGYALDFLPHEKLSPIINVPARGPVRLVIGVGTGFNACVVRAGVAADDSGTPLVSASECGQMSLPAADREELSLGDFIRRRTGFAAVEEVLSGRGLETVHAWLEERAGRPRSQSAAEICARAGDDGAAAVGVFMRILGVVAGDLALVHLPFGGIFLTGGVVRRLALNDAAAFVRGFKAKGRKSEWMERFPVFLIDDDFAALSGCAVFLEQAGEARAASG